MEVEYIVITPENIADIPGVICFINAKHPCFHQKVDWYRRRYDEGLRMLAGVEPGSNKVLGWIEYGPVEQCWRPVIGSNCMMIHCLWTNGKAIQHQGIGGMLLSLVEQHATSAGLDGLCTITSDGSYMANRSIFEKQGYRVLESEGKEQLLVKALGCSPTVSINRRRMNPADFSQLTMIYTGQCPWISRFVTEVQTLLTDLSLPCDILELDTPQQAQKAPSLYGSFNLIIGGKCVADRNISITRFKTILKKEMGIIC